MVARTGSASSLSRSAASSSPLLLLLRFAVAFSSDDHPKLKSTPKSQYAFDFDDARVLVYLYTLLLFMLVVSTTCDLFRLSDVGFRVWLLLFMW